MSLGAVVVVLAGAAGAGFVAAGAAGFAGAAGLAGAVQLAVGCTKGHGLAT